MKTKKARLKVIWTILRFIVPVALIGWLVWKTDWKTLWPLVRHIPGWVLLVSVLLFALAESVIAIRWQFLLRYQGLRVPFSRLWGLVFVGIFASNFLPSTIGGDAVKIGAIAQSPEKRGVAVASVVADRLYNVVSMALLLPLIMTLKGVSVPFLKHTEYLPVFGFAFLAGWPKLRERIQRNWNDIRQWFITPRCIIPSVALSWLSIGLAFGSFYIINYGMGVPITYWQAAGVSILTYFISLLPVSINGLGVQEGSRTYLLTLQGASLDQAIAVAFLIRLVTMAVSLLGGVRLLWGWRDLMKARQAPGPESSEEQGE